MAYLLGEKLAMLHIPKTGGIFLKEVLGMKPFAPQHTIAPCPPGRFMFCVIRDPALWLASFWGHMQRHGPSAIGPRFRKLAFEPIEVNCWCRDIPINDFFAAYVDKHAGLISSAFSEYISEVDEVIKNETLRISTIVLLDKYGELTAKRAHDLIQLGRKNKMPRGIRDNSIPTEKMKEAVRQAERGFCEKWGYLRTASE
jgi:hypothetical protein